MVNTSATSIERFLAAEEVDVDQEQAGFDARDVERQHAGTA